MKTLLLCVLLCASAAAQDSALLSRTAACDRFTPAVVRILGSGTDPKDHGSGTGFVVSPDGWIITAEHVIVSPITHHRYSNFEAIMADGETWLLASVVSASSTDSDDEDYALLKVDGTRIPKTLRIAHQQRTFVPFQLGEEADLKAGSDLVLIGNPIGAGFPEDLCLTATLAGIGHPGVYYQGIAVEGMSGGPVLSLTTGKVVGIIRRRSAALVGLDQVQNELRAEESSTENKTRDAISRKAVSDLLSLLAHQFNNGIGYATGVQRARAALESGQQSSH